MVLIRMRLTFFLMVSAVAHVLILSFWSVGGNVASRGRASALSVVSAKLVSAPVADKKKSLMQGNEVIPFVSEEAVPQQSSKESLNTAESSVFEAPIENYLPVSVLSEKPSPIDSIDPTPPGLSLEGVVGEMELLLLISSEGVVDSVITIRASLPEVFVDYAKVALLKTRFSPGYINKTAVRSRLGLVLSPVLPSAESESEPGRPLSAKNRPY